MVQPLDRETVRHLYNGLAPHYDRTHRWITLGADQRGRKQIVQETVRPGDRVLDCGGGTGSTALMAADATGPEGSVTLFDLSTLMITVAGHKATRLGLQDRLRTVSGDMVHLPFPDNCFDVVLSSYSLCPVYDPTAAALEMFRVTRAGGRLGIAHSVHPKNSVLRWMGDTVESIAWRFPSLSMGCRAVRVDESLTQAGARVILRRRLGVPLWPFLVLILEKPSA